MDMRKAAIILILFVFGFAFAVGASAGGRTIRVRILEQNRPRAITIRAEGGTIQVFSNTGQRVEIGAGNVLRIGGAGSQVFAEAGNQYASGDVLHVQAAEESRIVVDVERGSPLKTARHYTGLLTVDAGAESSGVLRCINHIPLEDYVASVLTREYGLNDVEGTRAMAVVVRTFALRSNGKFGDYDQNDHTGTQVFGGVERTTALSLAAARATEGEVLKYRGDFVEAFYFSSSGGYTADNETVWGGSPLPYLRAREDPYDASPHRSWRSTIIKERLLKALSAQYNGRVTGFTPEEKGRDGRFRSVSIQFEGGRTRKVKSNEFRLALIRHFGSNALKSTNFSVRLEGQQFVFEGKGYGHGVGLSQWGAHGMAGQGNSYRDILRYYYPGVTIERTAAGRMAAAAP